MNDRIKKKLSKKARKQQNITQNRTITKGDAIQACETVIKYAEQLGFEIPQGQELSLRGFNINIYSTGQVNIDTTCTNFDQTLEPVLDYERKDK